MELSIGQAKAKGRQSAAFRFRDSGGYPPEPSAWCQEGTRRRDSNPIAMRLPRRPRFAVSEPVSENGRDSDSRCPGRGALRHGQQQSPATRVPRTLPHPWYAPVAHKARQASR